MALATNHAKYKGTVDPISVQDSARSTASEMQKYFGPLRNSDIDTFASDAFAHETHNLPRAYVGRNKFLMATIDFLITKDDDWYTRHILPWLFTEELHVKWNIWRFNRTMMDYEPEQGVPRYVSYESESRSDSLVRRGLAFIIEHGFFKTEIGRQHYLMNLKQIVEAVHETVYFGVIHELLAAPNYFRVWQKKHGNYNSIMTNDAVTMLAEERWRFACVQKDIKGLYVLDAEIKDRMRRVGIEPDAWIFPSKMAIYASMTPEYLNEYSRGGQRATTALEDGAKRFDTFRGNRVFETRSFDTDFMAAGAIEPLVRHREIGEYYDFGLLANPNESYQIFDMASDRFHTITKQTAIGNICNTNDKTNEELSAWFTANRNRLPADVVAAVDGEGDAAKKYDSLCTVIVLRPRMTYRMATAILCKGGEELGQTLHGHHDFQLTDDVIHKTHIGHYTFYSKSVVREPKNMYLAEDVYCCGYDGGENVSFVAADKLASWVNETVTASTPSLVALKVVRAELLEGGATPAAVVMGEHVDGFDMSSDNHQLVGAKWLFSSIFDTDSPRAEVAYSTMDERDDTTCNRVCFKGALKKIAGDNKPEDVQHNTGHWGKKVYDGCAAVRMGMYAHLANER